MPSFLRPQKEPSFTSAGVNEFSSGNVDSVVSVTSFAKSENNLHRKKSTLKKRPNIFYSLIFVREFKYQIGKISISFIAQKYFVCLFFI